MKKQKSFILKLTLALVAVLTIFTLSSCKGDNTPPEKYEITFDPLNGEDPISYFSSTMTIPEDPIKIGYDFISWIDEDGNSLSSSKEGENIDRAYYFTASYDISENTIFVSSTYAGGDSNGSLEKPYNSITEALLSENAEAILVEKGTYAEDLSIEKSILISGLGSKVLAGNGKTYYIQGDLSNSTIIDGSIIISPNTEVLLDNMLLTNSAENTTLISSESSNSKLTLSKMALRPHEKGIAIGFSVIGGEDNDKVILSMENSYLEISGSIAENTKNGISFIGSSTSTADNSARGAVTFEMSNSRILDKSVNDGFTYPLSLENLGKIILFIEGSSIEAKNSNTVITLNRIGGNESDEGSSINIWTSSLKGGRALSAIDTRKLTSFFMTAQLRGLNTKSVDLSTIYIQDAISTKVTLQSSWVEAYEDTDAMQHLAIINSSSASSISINSCDVTFDSKPTESIYYPIISIDDQTSDNKVSIDKASMQSILKEEYDFISDGFTETQKGYDFTKTINILEKTIV